LYAAPCETSARLPALSDGCRFGDLTLSEGRLCLFGEPLFELEPAAAVRCIGHHRPLSAYVTARAALPLDQRGLRDVYARAERLVALESALAAANQAVAVALGYDAAT
jgi:hypothetical protein